MTRADWFLLALAVLLLGLITATIARADETRTLTMTIKVWRTILMECHVRASAPIQPGPVNSGFLTVSYTGTPERMACAQKILDKAATPKVGQ